MRTHRGVKEIWFPSSHYSKETMTKKCHGNVMSKREHQIKKSKNTNKKENGNYRLEKSNKTKTSLKRLMRN